VHTARQFYAARFFWGAAESSFFPGMIVYLTHWFCARDRSRAIACLYAANPAAALIGSPLAGWLLGVHWQSLVGWQLQAELQAKKKIRNYTIMEAFCDLRILQLIFANLLAFTGALETIFQINVRALDRLPPRSPVGDSVFAPGQRVLVCVLPHFLGYTDDDSARSSYRSANR
jgi:MFS family permease